MKMHTFLTAAKAVHPSAGFTCHALEFCETTLIDVRLPSYTSSVGKYAAVVHVDAHGIIEDSAADRALKAIAEAVLHPDVMRPPAAA